MATRERPIIFSAPMVRAILAGTKTQTRRVVSRANSLVDGRAPSMKPGVLGYWPLLRFDEATVNQGPSPAGNPGPYLKVPLPEEQSSHRIYPRWWVGDRLWVRETCDYFAGDQFEPAKQRRTIYRADPGAAPKASGRWCSPRFMPRWASRLTLEITDVRVQRVQEISEADAIAEGVEAVSQADVARQATWSRRQDFAQLWNRIQLRRSDPGGLSWNDNPWVYAITFRKATLGERARASLAREKEARAGNSAREGRAFSGARPEGGPGER